MLKEVHLVPETTLAKHVAMIGRDDEDRVVDHPGFGDCLDQFADLAVEIGDIRIIGMPRLADLGLAQRHGRRLDPVKHAAREPVMLLRRHRGFRHVDLVRIIEIPPFLPRDIGVVRMDEAGDKTEWLVVITRIVEDPAFGEERDLLVIIDLEGRGADAGLLHRGHVVIPLVDTFLGPFPVRRPSIVRRVDVCRHSFLEPVHLVGSDKVHFSRQTSAIAH